jgi:hypothetical protein
MQNELSKEESLKLAEMVKDWKRVSDSVHHTYQAKIPLAFRKKADIMLYAMYYHDLPAGSIIPARYLYSLKISFNNSLLANHREERGEIETLYNTLDNKFDATLRPLYNMDDRTRNEGLLLVLGLLSKR